MLKHFRILLSATAEGAGTEEKLTPEQRIEQLEKHNAELEEELKAHKNDFGKDAQGNPYKLTRSACPQSVL